MFDSDFIRMAIVAAPAILLALTVHEFFHAWTAFRFGDTTARDLGRLTLNPLAHLDLIGTLMLFLSQFHFGWAKPVPVNPWNLRKPRVADFWISAAGPLSNMGLGLLFGLLMRVYMAGSWGLSDATAQAVFTFLSLSVLINVSLAFFNIIPLYPLDGSHILRNLLPREYEAGYNRFQRFAPIALIALIVFGGVWMILGPFVDFFYSLFTGLG
ncbi:MAG: site-2 protease family protein [Candidatus Zixiibacteriota bacterium]|nr:MAG: site-2 protease family protein [candidate division Zixibacteria bacterium]